MKLEGVSAPIVGTTSIEKLHDLLGMCCLFFSPIHTWWIEIFQGAVDVKLTEEEKKELESPYTPRAPIGHS